MLNSGRFWDCEPNSEFLQSRQHLSNADCVQIQIYHLLNNSTKQAKELQANMQRAADRYARTAHEKPVKAKVDHERLLACYERQWFHERGLRFREAAMKNYDLELKKWDARADKSESNKPKPLPPYRERYIAYFQSENVRALLREWDSYPEVSHRLLAYFLGSLSYDSSDFARNTENLSFRTEAQLPQAWRDRLASINEKRKTENKPTIEIKSLLNKPEELANVVWGDRFGNTQSGDGWKFRPRGMYQIIGREQYERIQRLLRRLYSTLDIDIVAFPDALWSCHISAKVAMAHFHGYQYLISDGVRAPLFELLKNEFRAFHSIRALQIDMDHAEQDQRQVAERSEMFLQCAKETAENKPTAWSIGLLWDELTRRVGIN